MRHQTGFTLVEMGSCILILGLLLGLSLPGYARFVEEQRATSAANGIHAVLAFARSHAVVNRKRVVLCRDGGNAECAFLGSWSAGAFAFEDDNLNSIRDGGEPIVLRLDPSEFSGSHVVGPVGRRVIGFNPDGRSAGTNLSLRICDRGLATRRLVIVSASGRPRTTRDVATSPRCGNDPPPRY